MNATSTTDHDVTAAEEHGPRFTWSARVRTALLVAYGVGYLAWFVKFGVIIDRISVLLAVGGFIVIGHIGRPLRAWLRLPLDLALYLAMWIAYDETRGVADQLGMPIQVESVRNIDRVLFLGADPVVWMQDRLYRADTVRFYDVIASIEYYSHFFVPVIVIALLWVTNRHQWVRFMRRFATVLAVACAMFVLLPTAPPWMAGGGSKTIPLDALPKVYRPAGRGWKHIGFEGFVHTWDHGRDWTNQIAAMPSLHAAFSLLVVLFFWPHISRRAIRWALLIHPFLMACSLVYLGEHYVIDLIAGFLIVLLSLWVWDRIELGRTRPDDDVGATPTLDTGVLG